MTDASQPPNKTLGKPSTTLVYKKYFVLMGVVCGMLLFFGTPPLVLQFREGFDTNYSRAWVDSLPGWVPGSMLLIGMGGGVLIVLVSILFGALIPSKVTRQHDDEVFQQSGDDE